MPATMQGALCGLSPEAALSVDTLSPRSGGDAEARTGPAVRHEGRATYVSEHCTISGIPYMKETYLEADERGSHVQHCVPSTIVSR